jgi:integrase
VGKCRSYQRQGDLCAIAALGPRERAKDGGKPENRDAAAERRGAVKKHAAAARRARQLRFYRWARETPIDQSEFARGFQAVLRVLKIRPRPFYNTRHTFISIALTLGCNQKWIAEQTGTSIAMIQEHYGRYIRDDGDALLRAYETRRGRAENRNLFRNPFAGSF